MGFSSDLATLSNVEPKFLGITNTAILGGVTHNGFDCSASWSDVFLVGIFKLKGYSAERKGEREDMQDAHVVMDDYISEFDKPPAGMYAFLSIIWISDID